MVVTSVRVHQSRRSNTTTHTRTLKQKMELSKNRCASSKYLTSFNSRRIFVTTNVFKTLLPLRIFGDIEKNLKKKQQNSTFCRSKCIFPCVSCFDVASENIKMKCEASAIFFYHAQNRKKAKQLHTYISR